MPIYKDKPTKDGRAFYFAISYKDLDGNYKKYKSKKYLTKKEAEHDEASYLLNVGKVQHSPLITYSQITKDYLQEKSTTIKPQSLQAEKKLTTHIDKMLGNVVIARMTASQYENFRHQLSTSEFSITYKNKIIRMAKTLTEYAFIKYNIVNNIPKKYKYFADNDPKEMQIYTLDQFNQFIEQIDNKVYYAYFTCLFYTGCRKNEANALKWSDINFEKKQISVNKSVNTKIGDGGCSYTISTPKTKSSIRNIPMTKCLLEALKSLDRNDDNDFVFGGTRPLPETTIAKVNITASKKANLPTIRIHDFRHSFTSMLINNLGVDNVALVSKMLGHSNIEETLKTYSHLWSNSYDILADKMNNL